MVKIVKYQEKQIKPAKVGEFIPYEELDVVPFEDKAMGALVGATVWTFGTALPFVVEGGFTIVGNIFMAAAKGLTRAIRKPKNRYRNIHNVPIGTGSSKPNIHITTNVNVHNGNVHVENNINVW